MFFRWFDLAADNRIIATACRFDQVSWGCITDSRHDEFVYHWTCAVNGSTTDGVPIDSDINGDGLVSMEEVFLYAEANDLADEEPQYSSTPDFLGGYTSTGSPFIVSRGYICGDLTGDMDDLPDPGENYWLLPRLMNYGRDASSLMLTLHGEELVIIDSLIEVASIPNLDSLAIGTDTWRLFFPEDASIGDSFDMTFYIWDSTCITDTFDFVLSIPKPEIRLTEIRFRDEHGIEYLDPGKSGNLSLTAENSSSQEAIDINFLISNTDPNVSFIDNYI